MKETATLNYDFTTSGEVRQDGDELVISGIASNWDVDRVGDAVTRHAMERGLRKYLETNPILLFNHSYSLPAGRVTRAWIDDDGLHIEARLPRPHGAGISRQWWDLVKAGVVKALSIGGVWRRELINGINYLTEVDLREISVAAQSVAYGTTFSVQAAKAFGDPATGAHDWDGLLAETRLLSLRAELAILERDAAELLGARA